MAKYLIGLAVLVVAGICCFALFANGNQDDTPLETQDEVYPSYTTNARSRSLTVVEQQPEVEEFVETEQVEAPSNVEVQEVAAEPMIVDLPMEAETEPDDTVSLDSFARPYNHTVAEEDFLKMSPEDQSQVISAVMSEARGLKMGVMGSYQETQQLIRAGNYSAAEEKASAVLDASVDYDGGQGSLTLSRVISLNSQNDSLGIMSLIYNASGDMDAKAQVDARMTELQATMKTLREEPGTSYSMYVNR